MSAILRIAFRFNWLIASNLTLSKTKTNRFGYYYRRRDEFLKLIRYQYLFAQSNTDIKSWASE